MNKQLVNKTKERVLLDESKLDGRIINLEAKAFKLGVDGGDSYLERCKNDPDLPVYLYGIIQSGDKPNRNGRIYPWEYLKRECIRYMENEVKQGLSYGECFAEGHKILTKDKGWVDFKDLSEDAVVATMNPDTKKFEWQKILRKVEYDYEGDMIKLDSRSFHTMVTPNHKFFVTYNTNTFKYDRVLAKDLNSSHLVPVLLDISTDLKEGDNINNNLVELQKETVQYKGKVYCVEVPNHVILVMNEGKSFWSSNCDHPEDSSTPMLNNACWTIEDMSFKGTDVYAKIKVLNAYMPDSAPGKKIRGFLLNGKSVGISSRALGSLEQYSNSEYDIVAEDLEMVCWDAVSNASNFGSEVLEVVQEGKEKGLVKNKRAKVLLTESQLKKQNKEKKGLLLTEQEEVYLNILGLEEFLRIYSRA